MDGSSFNQAVCALRGAVTAFALLGFCFLAQAQQGGSSTLSRELTGLAISGPETLAVGQSASYGATASFSDGSAEPVAAKWLVRGAATIDAATGTLTAGPISACVDAALAAAVYSYGGITRTAMKRTTLVPAGGPVCTAYRILLGTVLLAGWNLVGDSAAFVLPEVAREGVAEAFGDPEKVTSLWKRDALKGAWIFYTPTLSDGGAAYAAGKGYGFLSAISAGEGFWVNARTDHIAAFGIEPHSLVSVQPALVPGWNLVAVGDIQTPSQFNRSLGDAPVAGDVPQNLTSLWAWDAGRSKWYFYAPSLEAQGGTALADYIAARGYLDFAATGKKLGPDTGFWVNKGADSGAQLYVAKSSLQRDAAPVVSDADKAALASDNTAFALDVYRQLLNDPAKGAGNLFFSPLSISEALAMTYAGAKGQTASEMASALRFTLPAERLHPAFDWLDLELASRGQGALGKDGQPFRLRVSNSLWGDAKSEFEPPFLDTLAQNYGAGMNLVDFRAAPEPSRIRINDWVAEQTEQRIKDLIPPGAIDGLTRLVLTNAVYFNAAWQSKFQPSATASDTFNKLDGSTLPVEMMNQTQYMRYAAGAGYEVVELPYDGGEVAMVVLLPAAGNFSQFENSLAGDGLRSILASLKPDYVQLGLPKFRVAGASVSVKEAMQKLGMRLAFSDRDADFSGISSKEYLYVSDILHKGFVEVDENGTEAAAATAVIVTATSVPPPPKIVKADRPFLFAIVDKNTGAIVFWGRVVEPTR